MIQTRKILAMAIMTLMVCGSVLIVTPYTPAAAEDSAKAFEILDGGFPLAYQTTLDQSCEDAVDHYTVSSGVPWAQTFVPTITGELSFVDLQLYADSSITLSVRCEIRTTHWEIDEWVPDDVGGRMTYEGDSQTLTTSPAWYQISMSTKPVLTAGQTYAIVLVWLSADFHWSCLGNYGDGDGFNTGDGGTTWSSLSGENFGFRTYMEEPDNWLSKVAWHGNNNYAYGVDGTSSNLYKFTRDTGSWSNVGALELGATFHDIVYDPSTSLFYIVGQDNSGYAAGWMYNHDTGTPTYLIDTFVTGAFYGVERAAPYEYPYLFLAVGEDTTNGKAYMCWYDDNSPWWAAEDTTPAEDATGDVIYDVAWNGIDASGSAYICVGMDASGDGVVYHIGGPLESGIDLGIIHGWSPLGSLKAVDGHPSDPTLGIIVGENTAGTGNAYLLDTSGAQPTMISDTSYIFNDVDWRPDGEMAVAVGAKLNGKGVMCQYNEGTDYVVDLSADLPTDAEGLFGVAMKGFSSPSSGLIVGSSGAVGFYPSAVDSGTTITVSSEEPHMFNMDMWKTSDAGRVSKLNTQVDVETTYTFMAEVNYTKGGIDQFYTDGDDDVYVILTAWFDYGVAPSSLPGQDDYNRTRMFQAIWVEGGAAPGNAGMMYPVGSLGTNEVLLDSYGFEIGASDHYYVYFNLTFGPQMWAADGNGFTNGATSDIYDYTTSYDDPNSWDFVMTVEDANFNSASNSSFEEFGIFQFTNITVSGNPGGNAPPGSSTQLGPNSQMQVSSNIDYYVNVSIPDLARIGGGTPINATYVSVNITSPFANNTNSMINGTAVSFPGGNMTLGVWGNTSQAFGDWVVAAPLNSTTAHGPQGADFQSIGTTDIEWWIDVPGGTDEGIYQATVTFKIGYN